MALYPRERWLEVTDVLIFHGRRVCLSRRPALRAVRRGRRLPVGADPRSARLIRHASGTPRALSATCRRPHAVRMGRIELELYADRLSRHAERLRDDIDGARMRIAWARFELDARTPAGRTPTWRLLEAVGALVGADEAAERRLLRRQAAPAAGGGAASVAGRGGVVEGQRRQQPAVVVVGREQVDPDVLGPARAVAQRHLLVELAHAPLQHHRRSGRRRRRPAPARRRRAAARPARRARRSRSARTRRARRTARGRRGHR